MAVPRENFTTRSFVEKATVESKAYDENGKQLGSPHVHTLIRRGGGRWYVDDLAPRF